MNPQDIARYKQSILNAQTALKRHEFFEARQWALSASQIAPEREEPWLLLAAVSEPGESISFLQRALSINPTSERAARGMQWALARLAESVVAEAPTEKPEIEETQPIRIIASALHQPLLKPNPSPRLLRKPRASISSEAWKSRKQPNPERLDPKQ